MSGKRVAVIGAGIIARGGHIPCIKLCGDDIVLIIDTDKSALEKAKALAPSAECLTSARMGAWDSVDCAVICTPPTFHVAQAESLLRRGIAVLCEKPLAPGRAEAESLAALSREKGVHLQAGYWRRYQPAFSALGRILRNGDLGEPLSCRILAGHIFRNYPPSLTSLSLSAGGAVMDFGVHIFDLLLGLCDEVTIESYRDDAQGGMESEAEAVFKLRIQGREFPAEIILSRTRPLGYTAEWIFERGRVLQDLEKGEILTVESDKSLSMLGENGVPSAVFRLGPPLTYLGYFEKQWHEFRAALAGKPSQVADIGHAVQASALVESCYGMRQPLHMAWGD